MPLALRRHALVGTAFLVRVEKKIAAAPTAPASAVLPSGLDGTSKMTMGEADYKRGHEYDAQHPTVPSFPAYHQLNRWRLFDQVSNRPNDRFVEGHLPGRPSNSLRQFRPQHFLCFLPEPQDKGHFARPYLA